MLLWVFELIPPTLPPVLLKRSGLAEFEREFLFGGVAFRPVELLNTLLFDCWWALVRPAAFAGAAGWPPLDCLMGVTCLFWGRKPEFCIFWDWVMFACVVLVVDRLLKLLLFI